MDEICSYKNKDYKCDYPAYTEFSKDEKFCIFHTEYGKKWEGKKASNKEDKVYKDFKKYLDEYEISEAKGFIFPSRPIISNTLIEMVECIVYGDLVLDSPHYIFRCKFYRKILITGGSFEKNLTFEENLCSDRTTISVRAFKDLSISYNYFQKPFCFIYCTFNGLCTIEDNYINRLDFLRGNINGNVNIDNCSLSTIGLIKTSLSSRLYIGNLNQRQISIHVLPKDFIDNLAKTVPSINLSNIDISNQGHITLDTLDASQTSFWKTNLLKDKPCIDFKLVTWGKNYKICDDTEDKDSSEIERLYRQIRVCYESKSDHGTADKFYVHEMQYRRKNTESRIERFFNQCYWAFSRYGESIGRPLVWLGGMVFSIASILIFNGVNTSHGLIDYSFLSFNFKNTGLFILDFFYVILSSFQAIFIGKSDGFQSATKLCAVCFTLFRITGLAIFTLLLLSIRRRFFRKS